MIHTRLILLCLLSTTIISGCATVYNGGPQTIVARASDNQKGVEVEFRSPLGVYPTKLPAMIATWSRSGKMTVKVTDKCYDGIEQTVGKSITPSYWANLLFAYGFLIDWLMGTMWKYDSNLVVTAIKKKECEAEGETHNATTGN